ncbi:MAG: aminotransferase class IV, partial [Pyrinomonadaceae bacterium]|nr:aminotransferase class IV [Pyrinomonadaceae bacterium]
RRLCSDALKLGIDRSGHDKEKVKESLYQVIKENAVSDGRCRITFFDESESQIWNSGIGPKTSLLIQSADTRPRPIDIGLSVSPFRINSASPLTGVKSCNYLENTLALEEARSKRGMYEALRLNENNEITSACMANVFWLKYEKLFTPSLKTGCLPGTTRELILEQREVFEVEEPPEALDDSDAMFLASSGIGIAQVKRFRDLEFSLEPHDITGLIRRNATAAA